MQQMGDGTTDPNFSFGLGSDFVFVFLKQKLVRKNFDSDQLLEQVHINTSQTNIVATWGKYRNKSTLHCC